MTLLNFPTAILLFFIMLISVQTNQAMASDTNQQERQTVRLGLRLIDVSRIDSKTETFTVEGILYVDWHDAAIGDRDYAIPGFVTNHPETLTNLLIL